ncbi:MAG: hypothetical protein LW875_08840 [Proteobacteria bacterium]|jgi:hypothetical protein|nr:hypothetical protein [Pseudomonadota bacterium]
MKLIALLLPLLVTFYSQAYVPPAHFIFEKLAKTSGSGVYQVDQDVTFTFGADSVQLKETWMIESDLSMKLQVTGVKELSDQISFFVSYSDGQRTQSGEASRRITEEFFERYFFIRNSDSWMTSLVNSKVIPASAGFKKSIRSLKDTDYQQESFSRLARIGGSVAYALGAPSHLEKVNPGVWIDQDQFFLRKLRLGTGAEIAAENHSTFVRGLVYPKVKIYRWENYTVTIKVLSVSSRTRENFNSFAPKTNSRTNFRAVPNHQSTLSEFYRRFR